MASLHVESAQGLARGERTSGLTSAAGRIYLWQGGSLWIGQGRDARSGIRTMLTSLP